MAKEIHEIFSKGGGFEYRFVTSPPDRVVCKICHLPSKDPHLTMCCGHVFCKSCLEGMKEAKSSVLNVCPMCRGEDLVTFPNKQIDREVKSLHVYCTNEGRGCEWQGEINYIDNHLTIDNGCDYEDVLCACGCGGIIQRQDLTKHVETECPCRMVNCQYCQLEGEHQFIKGKHEEKCIEYPLACPNMCEQAGCISRKDMNKHRNSCPLEIINCEYQTMGCEVRMTRQTVRQHNKEKIDYHLHLTKCKLDETRCELSKTKSKWESHLDSSSKLDETNFKLAETSCTLNETKSKLDKARQELDEANSKLNKTNANLEKAKSKLDEGLKELSKTKKELSHVKNEFGSRIVALEALLHQKNYSYTSGTATAAHNWPTQLHLTTQISSPGNGIVPVTFKMTGFAKKMKDKRDWFSKPFFTHKKGYRIRINVIVSGNDKYDGTHCSVYLRLMKGQYDDHLNWPFGVELEVMILNQLNDEDHFSDTVDFSEAVYDTVVTGRVVDEEMAEYGWGTHDFISHEDLVYATPTCQYLKDDCIFFRVCEP
ncbi:TNF receptor-associated factor 4-like [Dysidea avara]|uniref:TNF receptor-associated factor 4-like n=1 Tax=Dysidea avara TaxID=196820 RepID=UPI00331BF774